MSNKVTNIYIDTTGFCDEAIERVKVSLDEIVIYNSIGDNTPSKCAFIGGSRVVLFNGNGEWITCHRESWRTNWAQKVGLWELESIAFRCKQEKTEDELPTRNIYIDARKLNPVERINAFDAFLQITGGNNIDYAPFRIGANHYGNDAFILFDYYAITEEGCPLVAMEQSSYLYIDDKKELSFNEFMSLAR